MLSVVIPTCDSEEGLFRTLAALVPAAAEGVVREVVVADDGSRDGTEKVAEAAGCTIVRDAGESWGARMSHGIAAARRSSWVMAISPNVILEGEWFREVVGFVDRVERTGGAESHAATFRIAFDAFGWRARFAERTVGVASSVFGLPLPQQGLVMSRRLWDRARRNRPVVDHRDLVDRIGRRSIHVMRAHAVVLSTAHDGRSMPAGRDIARHALAAIGFPLRAAG